MICHYTGIQNSKCFLVNCEWASWGSWSGCGDSCSSRDGTGEQTRTRDKTREVANGGAECPETNSDDHSCTVECPGKNMLCCK